MLLQKNKPVVALVMGYPAGIGPEVTVKTLSKSKAYQICDPLIVGDLGVLKDIAKIAGIKVGLNAIRRVREASFSFGTIDVLDLHNVSRVDFEFGILNPSQGEASIEYLFKAFQLASKNIVNAVVVAPLNKEALHMANPRYTDDIVAARFITRSPDAYIVKVAKTNGHNLVLHSLTPHMAIREIAGHVKRAKVLSDIKIVHEASKQLLGIDNPHIAVSALNPHSGEGGLYGREEIDEIAPAIEEARRMRLNVTGPYPPSSIYRRAFGGEFDAVVGMYHDQINIPRQIAAKVSTSIFVGLPFPYTTTDHGTAFDIAGKGIADSRWMEHSLEIGVQLATQKMIDSVHF